MSLRTARETAALDSYRVALEREAALFRAQRNVRLFWLLWAVALVGVAAYVVLRAQGRVS